MISTNHQPTCDHFTINIEHTNRYNMGLTILSNTGKGKSGKVTNTQLCNSEISHHSQQHQFPSHLYCKIFTPANYSDYCVNKSTTQDVQVYRIDFLHSYFIIRTPFLSSVPSLLKALPLNTTWLYIVSYVWDAKYRPFVEAGIQEATKFQCNAGWSKHAKWCGLDLFGIQITFAPSIWKIP